MQALQEAVLLVLSQQIPSAAQAEQILAAAADLAIKSHQLAVQAVQE